MTRPGSTVARTVASILALVLLVVFASSCGAGGSGDGTAATPTLSPQSSAEATADARGTLRALFAAWRAKDVEAVMSHLSADERAVDWQSGLRHLDRVEFGEITESPELVDQYIVSGHGSATGVAPEDVRCFQADATFFYVPGYQGPADEGQALAWHWFLERDDAGVWKVTDWGF